MSSSIGLCAGLALEFALELPFAGAAQLAREVGGRTRDKIIGEFGQATYDYVIQFPIVLQSMPAMSLPCLIYDYEPSHMQQLYCRSQIRQIESYCQFRDLAPPRESGAGLRDSVDAIVVCHVSEITSK